MDLAELYRDNHKKSQEKIFTVEYIYGKSFFKKEKEIDDRRKNDTILIMLKKSNQDNHLSSFSN
tara:strand:+ start:73 stop:264 length:192 start_codon:yes stop_codon:yes gene_type:complete